MRVFNELFEKKNIAQLFLGIIMIIYLLVGYKMPCYLSNFIDSSLGKLTISIIFLILFTKLNPIIGVLSIFVLYELIQRARVNSCYYSRELNIKSLNQYAPKEKTISSSFSINNQFIPITLEQEIVQKMAPICSQNYLSTKPTYTPILEDIYNSAPINYTGVN